MVVLLNRIEIQRFKYRQEHVRIEAFHMHHDILGESGSADTVADSVHVGQNILEFLVVSAIDQYFEFRHDNATFSIKKTKV
ncbi:MAG: hypothetical protein EGR45_07155 [Ruminococcaceae bacterium]|nr:hypothetical protein [Oscillospiraceae bacterium]